jgi:hypothetical protein
VLLHAAHFLYQLSQKYRRKDMGNLDKYFSAGIAAKDIIGFLGTFNMATQEIAQNGTSADIQSTGLAPIMLNGVLINALPADAVLDISAENAGDGSGVVISDGNEQYFAVMATADGTLSVWVAGNAAATGSAICKIPDYDQETYCCVGVMKIDASGEDFTVGTTALTDRVAFYQMIGPVFPYPDNIDND